MGASAVGPWVGRQMPLGKTPLRGNPSPEMTYLPTYPVEDHANETQHINDVEVYNATNELHKSSHNMHCKFLQR